MMVFNLIKHHAFNVIVTVIFVIAVLVVVTAAIVSLFYRTFFSSDCTNSCCHRRNYLCIVSKQIDIRPENRQWLSYCHCKRVNNPQYLLLPFYFGQKNEANYYDPQADAFSFLKAYRFT